MRKLFELRFPAQFWLLFAGMLISTIGASMIWPFLMIYVSERLDMPLAASAFLLTINSVSGLVSSFLAGPVIDRLGRKWVMAISLFANASGYLLMSQAHTYPAFVALMILQGAANPLYRVGADAMMADLIPSEKRIDAYALMRLSNNVGVAIGPAVGGLIASVSYQIAFYGAAIGLTIYGLLVTFLARETLPQADGRVSVPRERFGGYGHVFGDRQYASFLLAFIFTQLSVSVMWVLLSVYAKTNYGVTERLYGTIPMTNALMVVLLQIPVTMLTRRYAPLPVMALGGLLYGVGVGSVAFGAGFWGFWISMVIMTVGELVLVPTSSTYAANLAPEDMRGRYLSLYGLTWNVAAGIGPVAGGFLNDAVSPQAIWYGGGLCGLVSALLFIFFWLRRPSAQPAGQTLPGG
ncbi:MAG: MFS transporter [Chloroflexota bacterium]